VPAQALTLIKNQKELLHRCVTVFPEKLTMNAKIEFAAGSAEAVRSRSVCWRPVGLGSPKLVAAIDALAAYGLRQPDPTLAELYLALQATGYTWSTGGKLTFSRDRMALVTELDALIEAFGRDTSVARLFL
jgi:hypothetical protein